MSNLILPSLEIRNFRGFEHLQIERLGRVNLIVGKNNIGKTSLLEALSLYAAGGSPSLIWDILKLRDESNYIRTLRRNSSASIKNLLSNLRYLFYGREDVTPSVEPILIGAINRSDNTLSIGIGLSTIKTDEGGNSGRYLLQPEEYSDVDNPIPSFIIQFGEQRRVLSFTNVAVESEIRVVNCISIIASGLDQVLVEKLWDRIVLTELEENVLTALRIVAPGIERLSFAGDPGTRDRTLEGTSVTVRERSIPITRVANMANPIPLRSLGDGMQRMLGIALALVNVKDGMLLVDEIENGLHYSVLPDLWRLVFQLAHRLNIQVFATTHSWDCIEAFQKAAQEDQHEEAMLIRLQSRRDEILATLYNEEELSIVTRDQIEVR